MSTDLHFGGDGVMYLHGNSVVLKRFLTALETPLAGYSCICTFIYLVHSSFSLSVRVASSTITVLEVSTGLSCEKQTNHVW